MTLKISGKDAKDFLLRQASNKFNDYNAFLKAKAQIVSLTFIELTTEGTFLVFCKNPKELKAHLEKFIIIEELKIEIDNSSVSKHDLDDFVFEESIVKLYERQQNILEKYIDFAKGCFPGQEVLAKFKNIGLKKKEERAKNFLDQALEIFANAKNNKEELDPAIELLKKAIKEDPKNEDAYESLGVMYAKQENFAEAIKIMLVLELINPKNAMALMNLSIFYMKLGDKETAENYKAKATILEFEKAL